MREDRGNTYELSSEDREFVERQAKTASNPAYAAELLGALKSFETLSFDSLVFQLGTVDTYRTARIGVRYSRDYRGLGQRLWQNFRGQIYDLLCGDSVEYAKERAKLKGELHGGLVVLVPILISALGLPAAAAGVATVLALIILKIGLRTLCVTDADLRRLKGDSGDLCSLSGHYLNLKSREQIMVQKEQRFPPISADSEWVFIKRTDE